MGALSIPASNANETAEQRGQTLIKGNNILDESSSSGDDESEYISDSDYRDLLEFLFPSPEALYAVLTVYADESRTAEKIPVVGVGGGVGSGLQWKNLLKGWREALATEPDVQIFHTSEFETPEGRIGTVYENWDDPRLMAFQNAMLKAKKENHLGVAMAACVSVEDFNAVATPRRIKRCGDEYFFCAYHLIHQVAVFAEQYFPRERVTYVFEEGGPHQDRVRKSYEWVAKANNPGLQYFKFWKAPTFAPKDSDPALQIADKLVYEAAKHASHFLDDDPDPKFAVTSRLTGEKVWNDRYPTRELVLSGWDVHSRMYDASDIEAWFQEMEAK